MMTSKISTEAPVDVLVIGAGPAGLTAALGLRRRGVTVRIVATAAAGASTSRAAVVHARTLEVLDEIGLAQTFVEEGVIVPTFTMRDRSTLLALLDFRGLPTRFPFTLMIPQSRTEAILEEALEDTGVRVEREVTFVSFDREQGATTTGVVRHADGRMERIEARYVIGADGAHSTVRQAVRIPFEGSDYAQSFILADVEMTWPLPEDEVQLFFGEAGLMVIAPLPGGHHRIVATADAAEERVSIAEIQHLLDSRGPGRTSVERMVWSSRFRVSHRLAARYREGDVFLAGDAAHVHSPAGGQGMNTGIQDALDLAQRLAAVLDGSAPMESLSEYERVRRPVAAGVVSLTDRMTRIATTRGAIARRVRNRLVALVFRSGRVRSQAALRIAQLTGEDVRRSGPIRRDVPCRAFEGRRRR
jgi:2-polyprenyl-6-methoxyphenol hydroxylase-like FAD-dependent oxidoreductase